ncbi:MAG: diaminopimelate decarboxylase [Deltaproteobacteria bacterium]|jgi:diaminopimelate decarboxylase|nr:diaminopimelate decarboxylase [Deltaproteobacteria bacterium]
MTDYFEYKSGILHVEDIPVEKLAEEYGTPLFVYSGANFSKNLKELEAAFGDVRHLLCYSVKAASNISLLQKVASFGMGADIVSGGELYRALKAGIPSGRIVYSGVGKTAQEMAEALDAGIFMFNLESSEEMHLLSVIAEDKRLVAPISFRVNPDVDPLTHPYIATGLKDSKFGIPIAEAPFLFAEAKKIPSLKIIGLDCHIGSQLTSTEPFTDTVKILIQLMGSLREEGINIRYLDIGGGLGINYSNEVPPTAFEYAEAITKVTKQLENVTLILEPGRSVVGNSCILVTRVIYNKVTPAKHFVVVDAAMNDLIRPSLYGSYHKIVPTNQLGVLPTKKVTVVGPICESGDFLAKDRDLPEVLQGELVAIFGAGAYGFSMSSNYNSRPRAAEVLVDGGVARLIRQREQYEDLINGESLLETPEDDILGAKL